MKNKLENLYPNRILFPKTLNDIPKNNKYLVYILTADETPIVLGHGKYNRAKVIMDNESVITKNHIKALFVRFYILFSNSKLTPYLIPCIDKNEAKKIENNLHHLIGGNNRNIPDNIKLSLFKGFPKNSIAKLLLEIAIQSSFDGLQDLKKWKTIGLINAETWTLIEDKLKLAKTNF